METSMRLGFMAVFAVSGSVVLLAHQVHKRILSNFMKKVEFEIYPHGHKKSNGNDKHQLKKKVRFSKQVKEPSPMEMKKSNNYNCRNMARAQRVKAEQVLVMENAQNHGCGPKLEDTMPPNRAVLYRDIMQYRNETPSGRFRF